MGLLVDNASWLVDLNYIDFLREIGRHSSVNRMLSHDCFKSRFEGASGLSFLEFNYMLLQSYDFLHLYREYDCRIQMGGSEHRRNRALVQPAFTRREMEIWRERWVQPMVDRILDSLIERGGPVDLYAELCAKVPVFTIASAFGVAAEDVPRFHELAVTQTGVTGTIEDRMQAALEIADSLKDVIERRRVEPSDDLIGLLCKVEIEDPDDGSRHRLDDDEILGFARLMLTAGSGTTYRALGCLLCALL